MQSIEIDEEDCLTSSPMTSRQKPRGIVGDQFIDKDSGDRSVPKKVSLQRDIAKWTIAFDRTFDESGYNSRGTETLGFALDGRSWLN